MSGPAFLALYAAAFVLAGAGTGFLLARRRDPWAVVPDTGASGVPETYLVAVLAGGPTRVVDTAVHALVSDGRIRVGRDHRITRCGTPEADQGDAVQRAVLDALADPRGARLPAVRAASAHAAHPVTEQARAHGLLWAPGQRARLAFTALLPMLAVTCAGVARAAYELGTGGPAALPLAALALSLLVIAVVGANVPPLTPAGLRLLERARTSVAAGRTATARVRSAGGQVDSDGGDLAAVALNGSAGIADDDLRDALYGGQDTASDSSSHGGSWLGSGGSGHHSGSDSGHHSGGHSHSCGGHSGGGHSCGSSCGSGCGG